MGKKLWLESAQQCLEECLVPVPHEVNELDWKVRLSENKERLTEHIIASANHPDGACLVFGVADDGQPEGIDAEAVAQISNTLANLGRDAVEPCVAIDHGVIQFRNVPLLFVRVPEHLAKPVHRRGSQSRRLGFAERGTGFQKVVSATEMHCLPPIVLMPLENAFRVTLYGPRSFAEMTHAERVETCYQHAVLKYLSSATLTNTSLRQRFRIHDRYRTQIANLIQDAVEAGRIKRKDVSAGKKFAEYLPYWA